jgi:acylphosphatase
MQARIYILGFVQGVGLRRFIKKNAEKLDLKGFVPNLDDGRVEAVVKGSEENINKLVKIVEKGTFFSDVKSVDVNVEKEEEFEDFKILH